MIQWLSGNLGTVVIAAALIAAVLAIIVHLVRKKSAGGCASCDKADCCHRKRTSI
jgi:hypothetical protein